MSAPLSPDNCDHHALEFVHPYGHETPLLCQGCWKLFPLWEGIAHVRALIEKTGKIFEEGAMTHEDAIESKVPHIAMPYMTGFKRHKRTGRLWLAFPDFDLRVGGLTDDAAKKAMGERLKNRLELNMQALKLPPMPKQKAELQKIVPDFDKWEWEIARIDIGYYLFVNADLREKSPELVDY